MIQTSRAILFTLVLPAALLGQPPKKGQAPIGPEKAGLRELGQFVTATSAIRLPPQPGRKVGAVDVEKTIEMLKKSGVDTYDFLIWQGPRDLDDLEALLPAAQKAGLKMWASIVPPTLGGNSLPHKGAWSRWAEELATLAGAHSNLVAMNIVDLHVGRNHRYLPPHKVEEMRKILNEAGLSLFGGAYDCEPEFAAQYAKSLDGIVLTYVNMRQIRNLDGFLSGARKIAVKPWKIFAAYYAAPTHSDSRPPDPLYLYYAMRRALARVDGVVVRDLDLTTPSKVHPGKEGVSNLVYTVRDFAVATRKGGTPQRPNFQ